MISSKSPCKPNWVDFGNQDITVKVVSSEKESLFKVPYDFPVSALLTVLVEGSYLSLMNDHLDPFFIGFIHNGRIRNISQLKGEGLHVQ